MKKALGLLVFTAAIALSSADLAFAANPAAISVFPDAFWGDNSYGPTDYAADWRSYCAPGANNVVRWYTGDNVLRSQSQPLDCELGMPDNASYPAGIPGAISLWNYGSNFIPASLPHSIGNFGGDGDFYFTITSSAHAYTATSTNPVGLAVLIDSAYPDGLAGPADLVKGWESFCTPGTTNTVRWYTGNGTQQSSLSNFDCAVGMPGNATYPTGIPGAITLWRFGSSIIPATLPHGSGNFGGDGDFYITLTNGNSVVTRYDWGWHTTATMNRFDWGWHNGAYTFPVATTTPTYCTPGTDPDCNSNVMFLPGIKGSRLYRPDYNGGTETLWEPGPFHGAQDVQDLALSSQDGSSIRDDVYTKKGDILNAAYGIYPVFYESFINDMNAMRDTEHLINDWEAISYDWRLTPERIVSNGAEINGRIYYDGFLAATSTPYITQELRRLAANSKTGKVTIVAHSNGGLITKALLKKLADVHEPLLEKIDKVIFVAVPQDGTPQALAALLYGDKEDLPGNVFPFMPNYRLQTIVDKPTARAFAENAPVAYNLLPSAKYFQDIVDQSHAVVQFDSLHFYQNEQTHYGATVDSANELYDFVLARDGGRTKPDVANIDVANVLNPNIVPLASALHDSLDSFKFPDTMQVYQIAGWGNDTLAGIKYYEELHTVCPTTMNTTCAFPTQIPVAKYKPIFTEDGDGTVVTPSALASSVNASTTRFWVQLGKGANAKAHGDIFESPDLRDFVKNIFVGRSNEHSNIISENRPDPKDSDKKLFYILHSPLSLTIQDAQGRVTGYSTATQNVENQIPGSSYNEFGEVKYISVPAGVPTQLTLRGYASGTFSLDMEELTGDTITATTTFADIPTATSTIATMDSQGRIASTSALKVDIDGNGTTDLSLSPQIGATVYRDIVPPEAEIAFDPLTQKVRITGIDNSGTTTVKTTATSTTIFDPAGNTVELVFSKYKTKGNRIEIAISAIKYNGFATTAPVSLVYKWTMKSDGTYKMLAGYAKTLAALIETHFRPKTNQTIVMTKPAELDESESDDSVDTRPAREKLQGLRIIKFTTDKGAVRISY